MRLLPKLAEQLASVDLWLRGIENAVIDTVDWDIMLNVDGLMRRLQVKGTFPRRIEKTYSFSGSGISKIKNGHRVITAGDLRKLTGRIHGFVLVRGLLGGSLYDWRVCYMHMEDVSGTGITRDEWQFTKRAADYSFEALMRRLRNGAA